MKKDVRSVIVVELVAGEDPLVRSYGHAFRRDADVRLKAALKILLRCFGLRCVGVRDQATGESKGQDLTPSGGSHAA
ncbi:hypothetical protein [Limnoglobus roseus]|uniref:Uncharacterized protein n=1 Tax=Limnoglobus roseus TaxID=2598579 RepID=A0A5C1ABS3_9BACT|nr:hypothetical protein [Limnoglobus roseus]QEL15623.1 hypothetical protein PX52LOC_02556 [Limnoglobus roseus]